MATPLLSLFIRWLHVLGMALVLGGAVLTWGYLRYFSRPTNSAEGQSELAIAQAYEWVFWGAIGVLVMTGIGNLGELAPLIPSPETRWGLILTSKLLAVLMFLLLSAVRLFVLHVYRTEATLTVGDRRVLQFGYGLTALYLIGILVLAEVLAHG